MTSNTIRTANVMNFFKMNLFRAALHAEFRIVVTQQDQNELTLTQIYKIATTQRRESADSKRVTAIWKNNDLEPEVAEVAAFQGKHN
jgi:hypothetical protein